MAEPRTRRRSRAGCGIAVAMHKIADPRMSDGGNGTMLTRQRSLCLHQIRSLKGLRLDERIGCRRTSDAQYTRTTTHSRNASQAGVQPKTRAHLCAHTCISSTGAPLHSGTAKWSRVCAAFHAEGSVTEPFGHSPHSPGMRSEERGSPKAPRPADATSLAMGRGRLT